MALKALPDVTSPPCPGPRWVHLLGCEMPRGTEVWGEHGMKGDATLRFQREDYSRRREAINIYLGVGFRGIVQKTQEPGQKGYNFSTFINLNSN